jgi:hypothetical protein
MAEQKFKKLRAAGDWGGHAANVLTFITTNWSATLAAILGIGTWLNKRAWGVVMTPAVEAGIVVFLAVLWTVIGLTVLFDRRKPRKVQTHLDYRYGLTFEGAVPQFIAADAGVPQAGCLGIGIQVRNFSPGPIGFTIEAADFRLGNRATKKYKANSISGYMARGAGRTNNTGPFESKEIKDFYGAGLIEGTADVTYTYGPPEEPPRRRLKISLEIAVFIPKDGIVKPEQGHMLGFNSNIVSEIDTAI